MNSGYKVLSRLKKHWQALIFIKALFLTVGISSIFWSVSSKFQLNIFVWHYVIISALIFSMIIIILKPWKVSMQRSAQWVDAKINEVENSAYLLTKDKLSLTLIAALQQQKISDRLVRLANKIQPPLHWFRLVVPMVLMILFSWIIYLLPTIPSNVPVMEEQNQTISFVSNDSTIKSIPAKIQLQKAIINPPDYTGLKSINTTQMNISALVDSDITWILEFNQAINKVFIETLGGKIFQFKKNKNSYQISLEIKETGFYKFVFYDQKDVRYESDIYQLIAIEDKSPIADVIDIDQFTMLEMDDKKDIAFTTVMRDDYGLASASIIATVSKGSGESVKFREEKMEFDRPIKKGIKSATRKKSINLNDLKMEPGDELYFYIEVFDTKKPKANRSRTETYFVAIRDTAEITFSLEGSLGVDLMPDYFRSQRQLIIDTEKLIKDKLNLAKKEFNSRSNELGYDQKALRLKYGQFMGEEFETGITEETQIAVDQNLDENHEETDPLAEYSHKHDSDNEHNLVPDQKKNDPLDEYKHNHDDPEETTLYIASVKGKLRAAMNVMWDAELYLRLFQPERSLPYQYQALELIKEIKNHARIYVHRMGFDPPPIKEDNRLTGNLEKVKTKTRRPDVERIEESYPSILAALQYIEVLNSEEILDYKADVFKKAGGELANLAIESPGQYLEALQNLQKLTLMKVQPNDLSVILKKLQNQLHRALPSGLPTPYTDQSSGDALTKSYLNQLNQVEND